MIMDIRLPQILLLSGLCTTGLIVSGCASVEPEPESSTEMITGESIREMSDKMMRSLLDSSVMIDAKKAPRVAMLRFKNCSRFPVDSKIFLSKLRADLNTKANGRIIFLDRTHIKAIKSERKGKRNNLFTFQRGSMKQALSGADYFITGELRGLSGAHVSNDGKGYTTASSRTEYLLFVFYLVNSENSDILWEDQFEIEFNGNINITYL